MICRDAVRALSDAGAQLPVEVMHPGDWTVGFAEGLVIAVRQRVPVPKADLDAMVALVDAMQMRPELERTVKQPMRDNIEILRGISSSRIA